jgi:hypothetical protein
MLTTAAGPSGVWLAGSVYDLDSDQARRFIAARAAELVAETAPEPEPVVPEPEPEPEPEPKPKRKARRG